MSQWYNDPQQVAAKLTNLAGIQEVLTARWEAGFERHERLTELVLLGRLYVDQLGQMMAFTGGLLPPEMYAQVPPVCTWEEFRHLVEEKGAPPKDGGWWRAWSTSASYALPTATRPCPICGQGWNLTNFWDVHTDQDFADLPLGEFVGKTIHDVGDAIADRPEASYHLAIGGENGTVTIRPAGVPPAESLYREEGTMIHGPSLEEHEAWVAKHKEVPLDYVVQPEDSGGVLTVFRYQSYHRVCHKELCEQEQQAQLQAMREDLVQILEKVGFSDVVVEPSLPPQKLLDELKEEYDEDEKMIPEAMAREMPYFAVSTSEGKFGVMIGGDNIPWIDFFSTTFTPQDFGASAEEVEPGFCLVPLDPELGNLRLLYALFLRKREERKK